MDGLTQNASMCVKSTSDELNYCEQACISKCVNQYIEAMFVVQEDVARIRKTSKNEDK